MFIAVETSDLVHSTKMSEQTYKQAMDALRTELQRHNDAFNARFDIFRGDAFQVAYSNPIYAFKASLLTRLRLMHCVSKHPIKLTQALVFGHQDKIEPAFSQSMGEVFVQSGRLLERTNRRDLSLSLPNNMQAISLIQQYLNYYLSGLTQKQCEVLYYYIAEDFPEQHVIAEQLQMTRQNVAAHLKRGGADLLKQSILFFESTIEDYAQ
ncbi:hypothetical protein ACFO4O_04680 [Glaciecola siphonariae]|uniref:Uncharacterized protein n=1 Tax=Glaciecola siphonariae TaxID=521012 RepID=A0ABV9LUC2_9ALTE